MKKKKNVRPTSIRKDQAFTHIINNENKPAKQVCKPKYQNVHCNHNGIHKSISVCCDSKWKWSAIRLRGYLHVEAPEPAADEITPRLVMASIRPPYTMLFKISTLRPSTTGPATAGPTNGSVRVPSSSELSGSGGISIPRIGAPVT